jgi:hypothetical protein
LIKITDLNYGFLSSFSLHSLNIGIATGAGGNLQVLIGKAHVRGESRVRHPLRGCTRGCLLQHAIDLLKGKTLGLGNEDVGEGERDEAQRAPHKVDLGAEVGIAFGSSDKIGGDNTDDLRSVS